MSSEIQATFDGRKRTLCRLLVQIGKTIQDRARDIYNDLNSALVENIKKRYFPTP